MGRSELPAQIGQGKERGLRHGLHGNPSHDSKGPLGHSISTDKKTTVTSGYIMRGWRSTGTLPFLLGVVRQRARVGRAQYNFGFACGSFQYGRVVTYFSFASKRSFRNSFSVSCIFARILLAVVGPTPYTELAYTARFP